MRNLLITICFDGANYHGWQIQQNAVSVQQVFQEALTRILGTQPDIKGCSRTDSFVHAREFCISFHTNHTIPCERLIGALNHFLPSDIAACSCREVPGDFHARYSCDGKEYEYRIWNERIRNPFLTGKVLHYWYPLDVDRLNRAASFLLGPHDFTSFCAVDARERGNMIRTITEAKWEKKDDVVSFFVAADGFLYHMVRILVGTMLRIAEGKWEPDDMGRILNAADRRAAGPTAPPQGLYLNRVFYKDVR